jgi:threonine aldolase
VQAESHLYNDEGDCAQTLSGLSLIPLSPAAAAFTLRDVKEQVERAAGSRVSAPVGAISIESPVRRRDGQVFDFSEMREISAYARSEGIGLHLDGARVFLAAPYTKVSPREYAALFDTVYVSLYKYFNAASGAILAGPRRLLEDLYHTRRMFGGGMNQVWPHAAVALHFLDGFEERFARAVAVSEQLYASLGSRVERVPDGTNIAWWKAGEPERRALAAKGIGVAEPRKGRIPLNVNESVGRLSASALLGYFAKA